MEIERLHYMAEQIAREFAAQGEAEAVAATAEHIRLFWDPRMKAQLLASDRKCLSPALAAAVDILEQTVNS
ncbi:MAG: formate dehydrogenase subunit delta [Novosphingobium sp.]